jgi:hypothetical protein
MKMVDLVKHGAGKKFCTFYFKELPFQILRTDFNPGIALNFFMNIGKTEAAFFFDLFATTVNDLGVDEDKFILGSIFKAYVYHRDLLGDRYLRCRQTDALGSVHTIEHLVDQLGEFRGELGDGLALFEKDRVGIFDDLVEFGRGLANGVTGCDTGGALGLFAVGLGFCRHRSE